MQIRSSVSGDWLSQCPCGSVDRLRQRRMLATRLLSFADPLKDALSMGVVPQHPPGDLQQQQRVNLVLDPRAPLDQLLAIQDQALPLPGGSIGQVDRGQLVGQRQAHQLEGIILVSLPLHVPPAPSLGITVGDLQGNLQGLTQILDPSRHVADLDNHPINLLPGQRLMKRPRRGGDGPPSLRTLYNVVPAEQTPGFGQVDRQYRRHHHWPPGNECLLDAPRHTPANVHESSATKHPNSSTHPRGPRCIVSHGPDWHSHRPHAPLFLATWLLGYLAFSLHSSMSQMSRNVPIPRPASRPLRPNATAT